MGSNEDISKAAFIDTQAVEKMDEKEELIKKLDTTCRTLEGITQPTFLVWKQIHLLKSALKYKHQIYVGMSLDWLKNIDVDQFNMYNPRLEVIEEKSNAAQMRADTFDKKFKQEEEKRNAMELANFDLLSKVKKLDVRKVAFEELEAEIDKFEKIIPKAAEMKDIFLALQEEWFNVGQGVDRDLDDCVDRMKELVAEIEAKQEEEAMDDKSSRESHSESLDDSNDEALDDSYTESNVESYEGSYEDSNDDSYEELGEDMDDESCEELNEGQNQEEEPSEKGEDDIIMDGGSCEEFGEKKTQEDESEISSSSESSSDSSDTSAFSC